MEREARSKREPQARRAKEEREDRSKHCKRRRRRSTKQNKKYHERGSKSMETASPDIRLKPRDGATRRRLGDLSWERFVSFRAAFAGGFGEERFVLVFACMLACLRWLAR